MRSELLVLVSTIVAVFSDDSGRNYDDDSGKYVPDDEGRYIPDNSGQYIPDYTGLYHPDGSGRYQQDRDLAARRSGLQFANTNKYFEAASTDKKEENIAVNTNTVRAITPKPFRPQFDPRNENYQNGKWKIIHQSDNVDLDGYQWEYETENKILAQESGKVYNLGGENEAMRAQGSFQYTGPDNVVYSVKYTADENGFVAIGDHLPTPPPIPIAIAKALEVLDRAENKLN